jgi:hypothetical protein
MIPPASSPPPPLPIITDDWSMGGFDIVAGNNTYDITNLTGDTYYPFAIMDSNGDDVIDPATGDALGMYGVDVRAGDLSPDSVVIADGNRITGVNFPLFDPSAIAGTIAYDGGYSPGFYTIGVGLFDADNFDRTDRRSLARRATGRTTPRGRSTRWTALWMGATTSAPSSTSTATALTTPPPTRRASTAGPHRRWW